MQRAPPPEVAAASVQLRVSANISNLVSHGVAKSAAGQHGARCHPRMPHLAVGQHSGGALRNPKRLTGAQEEAAGRRGRGSVGCVGVGVP
jgi:hypothetical protein